MDKFYQFSRNKYVVCVHASRKLDQRQIVHNGIVSMTRFQGFDDNPMLHIEASPQKLLSEKNIGCLCWEKS